MCEIQDYLKSLNPKENEKAILIYGAKYKLWRNGEYLGVAEWCEDENVGDSFQNNANDPKYPDMRNVYTADKWELIF